MAIDPEVAAYYDRAPEESRLESGPYRLEAARTRELIARHAPPAPATVLDVGGAAGAYAFSLAELAREACLSEFHLLRVFKQAFGTTPARYLERCRMDKARTLLLGTELPIADVAASCGYSNLSAFGRAFRRAWGNSATVVREERSGAIARRIAE